MKKRKTFGCALLGAGVLFYLPAVQAGPITVSGVATGCFYAAPATTCTPGDTDTEGHLQFNGLSFTGVTTYTVTLGTVVLGNGTRTYDAIFDLLLSFSAPAGSQAASYEALLTGAVHGHEGSVSLDFDNPSQSVAFSGVNGTGSFSVTLGNGGHYTVSADDASVPLQATISGEIPNAPVGTPEPGTLALFGMGLVLVGVVRWDRSRAQRGYQRPDCVSYAAVHSAAIVRTACDAAERNA